MLQKKSSLYYCTPHPSLQPSSMLFAKQISGKHFHSFLFRANKKIRQQQSQNKIGLNLVGGCHLWEYNHFLLPHNHFSSMSCEKVFIYELCTSVCLPVVFCEKGTHFFYCLRKYFSFLFCPSFTLAQSKNILLLLFYFYFWNYFSFRGERRGAFLNIISTFLLQLWQLFKNTKKETLKFWVRIMWMDGRQRIFRWSTRHDGQSETNWKSWQKCLKRISNFSKFPPVDFFHFHWHTRRISFYYYFYI